MIILIFGGILDPFKKQISVILINVNKNLISGPQMINILKKGTYYLNTSVKTAQIKLFKIPFKT